MAEVIFEARNLTKTYRSGEVEVHALAGVDLELFAGELVVLLGPVRLGQVDAAQHPGRARPCRRPARVRFRDQDLTALDDDGLTAYRRDHVGFVFQFYNLIPSPHRARERQPCDRDRAAIRWPPRRRSTSSGSARRMDHFPAQMSGGEQQRVAIARAIAKQPDVLLCDEPTGALDSKTGVRVLEALSQVNRELGTTTALITHNAAIKDMAHRVLLFGDGRITGTHVNATRKRPPRSAGRSPCACSTASW